MTKFAVLTIGLLTAFGTAQLIAQQGQGKTQPKPKGKPCLIELVSADNELVFTGGSKYVGGNVKMKCVGQDVTLSADSVVGIGGYDNILMMGHVMYHDADYDAVADTLRRPTSGDQFSLRGNVRIVQHKNSSTLVGPAVDYYRANPGSKDTSRVVAFQRPTATVFPDRTGNQKTPAIPYILTADRMIGWGSDKLSAWGTVTLERDSLRVSGDSLTYLSGKQKMARTFGAPARVERFNHDSARIQGNMVRVDFADGDVVRSIVSNGEATLVRESATITSDTLLVGLKDDKLNSIIAWGTKRRAHLSRDGVDSFADSLALDSKDSFISELRLFRKSIVYQPIDSTASRKVADSVSTIDRDWVAGERIVISFRQVDSSGVSLTMVDRLVASQGGTKQPSCSLFSKVSSAPMAGVNPAAPSITYACAEGITIKMQSGAARGIDQVVFRTKLNGLQLDPPRAGGGSEEKQ